MRRVWCKWHRLYQAKYRRSGFQVRPFLLKAFVRRVSRRISSEWEVCSFNMRRTNLFGVGVSPHGLRYGVHHLGWRIPMFFLGRSGIDLNQLGEINSRSKAGVDGIEVGFKSVTGNLEVSRRGALQFFSKGQGVSGTTPSKVPSQDQLRVTFDGDKA